MPEEPLRILEFRARHIKRLKAVTIRPDPESNIVVLTGKNRQGKTSIIDAIWSALGGERAIPSKPIHEGETEASTTLDLGEFVVERRITENGSYLNVSTKEGFKASSPQTFLNSKLGARAQNPLEFMRLTSPDQVKALQGLVDIRLDLAEFERISGLPTKGLKTRDPIAILDSAHKHLYDKRTEANKEVKRLEGALRSVASEIPRDREDVLPVSARELFDERKVLEDRKTENERARQQLSPLSQRIEIVGERLKKKEEEIAELKQKLRQAEEEKLRLSIEVRDAEEKHREHLSVVEALVDPDFTDIDARIAEADETNRIANLIQQRNDHQAALDLAKGDSEDLTDRLKAITEHKTSLIQAAGLPVPGLGFENGEVTYNGIPLSQASGADQIEISCAVCMAQHPEIGVLTIDIGWSELDSESKAVLRRWAEKTRTQIWVTKVADQAESEGFHILGGEVVAVNGEPLEEEPDREEPFHCDSLEGSLEEVSSW